MRFVKKSNTNSINDPMEKQNIRIKKRNKWETIAVLILCGAILLLELIKADIIPGKKTINSLFKILPPVYPVVWGWYKNVYDFAGNSFTQVTAFFSAFASTTFFIIGRFNEGIIGVPLEELLVYIMVR